MKKIFKKKIKLKMIYNKNQMNKLKKLIKLNKNLN